MQGKPILVTGLLAVFTAGPLTLPMSHAQIPNPPKAKAVPTGLEKHGHVRIDDYYWLRERDDPEVIAYLEAENAYTAAVTAHTEALQEALFQEMRGRIKEDDSSVPYLLDGYYYYTRYEEGKEYPIYARKRGSLDASEEIMLDVNERAGGHTFYAVGGIAVSFDNDVLAYTEDTVGRRIHTVRFKNLTTGEPLPDEITDATANIAWANDNRTMFYTRQDPTTLRWYRVYRHELGTDPSSDVIVYEEPDEEFSTFVFRTKSKAYLMIGSYQTVSTEYRFLDAHDPTGVFTVIQPRERDHEYDVDHYGDKFYIRTNWNAKNFRLMETPASAPGKESWSEIIPHREDVLLRGFEIFSTALVLSEREEGLVRLRVRPWEGRGEHYLDFGEPAYWAGIGVNPAFDTKLLRYNYTSLTTPNSVYDYDMLSREKTLRKREQVLGGFRSEDYVTERLWATAADGVRIPISLVYRRGLEPAGTNPLLLYGYGSYGFSMDATFSSERLSLLERGFVFAIAHVRGGQEMGRWWYEDGKLLEKMNTFTDFISCAERLVAARYTSPNRLFAMGGSAGGLLMGAVANLRPDLFEGIVAQVPFVDLVTTMLDESIPLTTSEYDEWGNPNDRVYYDYMLSYSPYDNVEPRAYPNILVTAGLHDSQVQYWEPAKWVAKLRATKTDHHLLLLKTNLEAGHGGASGRFRRLKETALEYAFLLDLAGLVERPTP